MSTIITNNEFILSSEMQVFRYSNETSDAIAKIYFDLEKSIGCTYLVYLYENLNTNIKHFYSSNWEWQDLLIGEKLINNCPIYSAAFKFLDSRHSGQLILPWHLAPSKNKEERNVCGIREEHNIANGIGFISKGHGIRESFAFAGDVKDHDFYKNFVHTRNSSISNKILRLMRRTIVTQHHQDKLITDIFADIQ